VEVRAQKVSTLVKVALLAVVAWIVWKYVLKK
jgi:hypothetical protein